MQIRFFRSTWGMEQGSVEEKLRAIKGAGFDGVELGVPHNLTECATIRDLLDEVQLQVIVQQWTAGTNAREHADSLAAQYERAVALQPLFVNSHTGKDYFSTADNLLVIDRASRLEMDSGIAVLHETHRGRAFYSTVSTMELLSERPFLKLTADFSHWCCVHESLLEDQQEPLGRASKHAHYIHARVGHQEGPQVTDPRVHQWTAHLELHLGWWRQIIKERQNDSEAILPICPEFGPPPYMVTLPGTGHAIANLWDINCWMKDWLKSKLTGS